MKAVLGVLLSVALILGADAAIGEEPEPVQDPAVLSELQESALTPLFSALRTGDLSSISSLLDRELYARYQVLLEQNETYGQFLRDYYDDTVFVVDSVVRTGDGYVGNVLVYWSDGHSVEFAIGISEADGRPVITLPSL